MSDFARNMPRIAPTSNARNPHISDSLPTAKVWAGREDLSGFTDEEIRLTHARLLADKQALLPYASPARVAYRRLSAEKARRGL